MVSVVHSVNILTAGEFGKKSVHISAKIEMLSFNAKKLYLSVD